MTGHARGDAQRGSGGAERGSATVMLLAVVVVALVVAVGAMALARAAHARGTAQTAADLAAIAAADAHQRPGGADPCQAAASVVAANAAQLISCTPHAGGEFVVITRVDVSPLSGWHTSASASSRAGPVRRRAR